MMNSGHFGAHKQNSMLLCGGDRATCRARRLEVHFVEGCSQQCPPVSRTGHITFQLARVHRPRASYTIAPRRSHAGLGGAV
jgi:hypothetical protein